MMHAFAENPKGRLHKKISRIERFGQYPSSRSPGTSPATIHDPIEHRIRYRERLTEPSKTDGKTCREAHFFLKRKRITQYREKRRQERRNWRFFKKSVLLERANQAAKQYFRQMPDRSRRQILKSKRIRHRIQDKVQKWYKGRNTHLRDDFKKWNSKREWIFQGTRKNIGSS